jgi:hypothetical protein
MLMISEHRYKSARFVFKLTHILGKVWSVWLQAIWLESHLWQCKILLFSTLSRPAVVPTRPPVHWVLSAISPEMKQLRHEAYRSLPSSAEVNLPVYLHS